MITYFPGNRKSQLIEDEHKIPKEGEDTEKKDEEKPLSGIIRYGKKLLGLNLLLTLKTERREDSVRKHIIPQEVVRLVLSDSKRRQQRRQKTRARKTISGSTRSTWR